MDVQPTTSLEIVQAENQASIDALRRLASTRDALMRIYEAQPTLTESTASGAQRLLAALPGFWASPDNPGGQARSILLARQLASAMNEEATLRGLDGTLSQDATLLATRITTVGERPLSAGTRVRELMFGGVPHAGSLIVTDDTMPNLALLFTAHGGWEAFDSLERLLEVTRRRLIESVDAEDGVGLEKDEFAEAKVVGTVGSRDIAGPVFEQLANRMIEVQIGRLALEADDYALDIDEPDAAKRLGDRVRYELSSAAMFDIDAIESLREARLLEASVASRLAKVPSEISTAWYEARDTYNDALAATAMLRAATGVQPPLTLHAFASREIAAKLVSLGVSESPEAITVEIARGKILPEPLAFLDPLPGSTKTRRIPLVDFASQNIGRFSLETLHAVDAQGASLGDRLGHAAIRDIVRDLDLANRYQAHVEERLRQGPTGALARKLAMTVQAAQMRLEAAEARLSYYLPGEPHSFIDDRDERGFRWVEAALDGPAKQRHVARHEIVTSQLTYQQMPLDGILIFASRASSSASRMVMYTPGAPDGLTFREFETRQDAAKRFLYHPAFREYLLDRLPAEFAVVSPNGVTRKFAGDRLAHWVLGASGDASYTLTAEPFDERVVRGDMFAAVHDATVEKYRRDTRFLARSTADADSDALLGYVQARFDPVTRFVQAAAIDAPIGLAQMMQASWRFYDHVKAGDTGEAFVAFTAGYVSALALVTPPFVGGRHLAGAIVRSRTATHGVAATSVQLTPPPIRFEERYAARGLHKQGKANGDGIFRVRGQSYIEQDGTLFSVRHDVDYGHWRLSPAQGAMDARFTGPLIERVDGRWVYAHNVGLRGGMRRLRQRLNRMVVRGNPPPLAAAPDGAAAVAPVVDAGRPIALPAILEPHRIEITAALTDNPSGSVIVRTDGTHLKIGVAPRSAVIVDPYLHPDIAELSAHQRRVFLHELDTRFPLTGERAEVLRVRGWAQDDGRRIPSPPASPGAARDLDIQSPSISSSSGDSLPPAPALTPGQQSRWDEALAVARTTSRMPHGQTGAPAGSGIAESLLAAEAVPRDEWPSRVWYFSERRFEAEFWPGSNRSGVTLDFDSAWVDAATGVRTYPVSVLPPETPVSRLSEALGTSPVQQAGQRDPLSYALQIDMVHLREQWRQVGPHHVVTGPGAGLELRRRVLPNGEYQYLLQSVRPVRLHAQYIIDVSRRGERPTPLIPTNH